MTIWGSLVRRLLDVVSTTNLLFEVVLRGLGTQLEQAISLDPELITLWIVDSNDVLGSAKAEAIFLKLVQQRILKLNIEIS